MIASKINSLSPGQIMAYFDFYIIDKKPEFYLYKNNQNYFVFIYRDSSEELCFLETLEFSNHNKLSFFLFMVSSIDKKYLTLATLECIKIDDYEALELYKTTSRQSLLRAFFNLKKSDLYKGSMLEPILFERNGANCIVVYEDKKPIDIVSFKDNDEQVFSEFGNNFGYSLQNQNSNTLIATYTPSLLLNKNISSFNIAVTKFYITYFDFISIINQTKSTNIIIPIKGKFSRIYKLRLLIFFYSLLNKNLNFDFNHSPNFFYVELSFNFSKGSGGKLEILNLVSSFKIEFSKQIEKLERSVLDTIQEKYTFDLNMEQIDNNFVGKIVFRNNIDMLNIVIDKLQEFVNNNSDYKFT